MVSIYGVMIDYQHEHTYGNILSDGSVGVTHHWEVLRTTLPLLMVVRCAYIVMVVEVHIVHFDGDHYWIIMIDLVSLCYTGFYVIIVCRKPARWMHYHHATYLGLAFCAAMCLVIYDRHLTQAKAVAY